MDFLQIFVYDRSNLLEEEKIMQKFAKIILIGMVLFCLFTNIANAETTNLYDDMTNETTNDTQTNTTNDDMLFEDNQNSNTTSSSSYQSNARVSTVSSIPEANLGLNNVLCVILIAIGILIILLAIAILIRIK